MDFSNFWWQTAAADDGGGGDAGDPIGQSLRGHYPGGGYLLRKFAALGGKTYTHSFWAKTAAQKNAYSWWFSSSSTGFGAGLDNNTGIQNWYGTVSQEAGVKYRDPSAWMHIVHISDGTTVTRYVNGRNTGSATAINFCALNANHHVGTYAAIGSWRFDGFMADVHYVDGTALPLETFGRYNTNDIWVPVDPKKDGDTAWYGTNGYRLTFADPGDVGKDYSGNGNDFTATGFETTDQTSPTYDLMQDSPTNNFATYNPLPKNSSGAGTYSDANLTGADTNTRRANSFSATQALDRNSKYYWEAHIVNRSGVSGQPLIGVINPLATNNGDYDGVTSNFYHSNGLIILRALYYYNFSPSYATSPSPPDFITGDILSLFWDGPNNTFAYKVNDANEWKVTLNNPNNIDVVPFFGIAHSNKVSINLGQQPFRYTPPEGFLPLSTANMPTDELPDTITGEFTGNSNADGPFVYTGCIPARIQYGTIDVKYQDRFGQNHVDFLSNGFKVRSTTSNSGTVNYTVTTTHDGGEYDGNKVPFQSPAPAVSN